MFKPSRGKPITSKRHKRRCFSNGLFLYLERTNTCLLNSLKKAPCSRLVATDWLCVSFFYNNICKILLGYYRILTVVMVLLLFLHFFNNIQKFVLVLKSLSTMFRNTGLYNAKINYILCIIPVSYTHLFKFLKKFL